MKAVFFPFALAVFAGLAACGETRWIGEARRMPRWSDGEVSVLVRNVKGGVTLLFRADAEGRGGAWRFDERDLRGIAEARLSLHVDGDRLEARVNGVRVGAGRTAEGGGTFGLRAAKGESAEVRGILVRAKDGRTLFEEERADDHVARAFPAALRAAGWYCVADRTLVHPGILPKRTVRARRKFRLERPPRQAEVVVSSPCFYELWLDGEKVDPPRVMAPSKCADPDRALEDRYDLTGRLGPGEHCLGLWLAPGYSDDFSRGGWRWLEPMCVRAELRVRQADGSCLRFGTDADWQWTERTPVVATSIYEGETCDARLEDPDWSRPSGTDGGWHAAAGAAVHPTKVEPSRTPRVIRCDPRPPVRLVRRPDGAYVADFGQNRAGVVALRATGARGSVITVETAEELRPDGELDRRTNRGARSTDTFVLSGTGKPESFCPRFTYHGFRYARISGFPGELKSADLTGWAIHAELDEIGSFDCSDPDLLKIRDAATWSMYSNLLAYPSDCSMRRERTPCMMDVQTYQDVACKLFGMERFFRNYLDNVREKYRRPDRYSPDWEGGTLSLAWTLWREYGDLHALGTEYPHMLAQVERTLALYPDGIVTKTYGDWCAPNAGTWKDFFSEVELVNTALHLEHVRMTREAAEALGRSEDVKRLDGVWAEGRRAFNARFFDRKAATYSSGRQVTAILPLAFGLAEEGRRADVARELVRTIRERNGGRIDTGIFGTRYVAETLCDIGETDLLLEMFTRRDFPGFGYMFDRGATTFWEQWVEHGSMHSHNHAMMSGSATFLLTRLAGIRPLRAGYAEVLVKPVFPRRLAWASGSIRTPHGRIAVGWKRENGNVTVEVDVPEGMKAWHETPSGVRRPLPPGRRTLPAD